MRNHRVRPYGNVGSGMWVCIECGDRLNSSAQAHKHETYYNAPQLRDPLPLAVHKLVARNNLRKSLDNIIATNRP